MFRDKPCCSTRAFYWRLHFGIYGQKQSVLYKKTHILRSTNDEANTNMRFFAVTPEHRFPHFTRLTSEELPTPSSVVEFLSIIWSLRKKLVFARSASAVYSRSRPQNQKTDPPFVPENVLTSW